MNTTPEQQKKEGVHFTPTILAQFMARKILNAKPIENTGNSINILDPAIGDGELVIVLLKLIPEKYYSKITIFGYDINPDALKLAEKRINQVSPEIKVKLTNADYLDDILKDEDLFSRLSSGIYNIKMDYTLEFTDVGVDGVEGVLDVAYIASMLVDLGIDDSEVAELYLDILACLVELRL